MSEKIVRWGIIGLGRIAQKFAADLAHVPNARLEAVASNNLENAQAFGNQFNVPHRFGRYEDIFTVPLDAIYIANPHTGHMDATMLTLEKGVAVLCEKPLAVNRQQVNQMTQKAREKGVFLMEAIWTAFLPSFAQAMVLIGQGEIGTLHSVKADFGFKPNFDPKGRLYNPDLAGGATLDIGIYPLFAALVSLGKPDKIQAIGHLGSTGVDEEIAMNLGYNNGNIAQLHASIRNQSKTEAFFYGSEGVLVIHSQWYRPSWISILKPGTAPTEYRFEAEGNGYQYEAMHVQECLEAGLTESPVLSLAFSETLMDIMDEVRRQIGLQYPFEN